MRTGTQKRYYDVLRREDRRRPQATPLAASANSTGSNRGGPSSSGIAAGTLRGDGRRTLWDPIEGLHLSSTTVVSMQELVCDHRGLTALHPHFTRFEQLHCLVLSHNALRTVHHLLPASRTSGVLHSGAASTAAATTATAAAGAAATAASPYSGCRRLTHLFLDHNEIADVARDTDIPRLLLLEYLSLASNRLADLDAVIRPLYRLRHLRCLDLRGNPIADEPAYRQRCLAGLPHLVVLDGRAVTAEERRGVAGGAGRVTARLLDASVMVHDADERSTASDEDDVSLAPGPHTTATTTAAAAAAVSARKTKRIGRFAKSAIARDLDVRYAAHERQEARNSAVAAEAQAAVERAKEEAWGAFHAVWTLSQPGMPLSEEGYKTTLAAAAAAGNTTGTASLMSPNAVTGVGGGDGGSAASGARSARKSPTSQTPGGGGGGLAGRPRTPIFNRTITSPQTSMQLEDVGGSGGVTHNSGSSPVKQNIDVPRERLLPLLATYPTQQQQQTQPQRADGDVVGGGNVHDSPYLRTVRGTSAKGDRADYAASLSSATRTPSPVRLAALQRAMQASNSVVRALRSTDRHNNPHLTPISDAAAAAAIAAEAERAAGAAAVDSRKSAGGRTQSISTTSASRGSGITLPIDLHALRAIQSNKYAMIPPPWEREGGEGNTTSNPSSNSMTSRGGVLVRSGTTGGVIIPASLGRVQPRTMIQEALIEVLVLLHHVYSSEEVQLLELEYGKAELLRLLPVDTLAAARQEMMRLLRPGTAGGTGGGGGGTSGGGAGSGGGGANSRRPGGDDKKKGGGGAGGRSGNAALGSISASGGGNGATSSSSGLLSSSELAAAALAAARGALSADPAQVFALFLPQPPASNGGGGRFATAAAAASKGVEGGMGGLGGGVGGGNTSSSTAAGGGGNSAAASAAAAAATAAGSDEMTLSDPEAIQQLVRPVGPYDVRVLTSLLKMLRPSPVLDAKQLCDDLRVFHGVGQPHTSHAASPVAATAGAAAAAAASPSSTTTQPGGEGSRGAAVGGVKSKKDAAATTASSLDGDGGEGKKRAGKGSSVGNNSAAANSNAAAAAHDHGALRPASPAATPQMSLLNVLASLLFHPGFVRARLSYWEEELVRQTMAAAAAAPAITSMSTATATGAGPATTTTSTSGAAAAAAAPGSKAASASASAAAATMAATATPLARLFHRVQALKTHTARVETAAATAVVAAAATAQAVPLRPGGTEPSKEMRSSSRFVSPIHVLKAFS